MRIKQKHSSLVFAKRTTGSFSVKKKRNLIRPRFFIGLLIIFLFFAGIVLGYMLLKKNVVSLPRQTSENKTPIVRPISEKKDRIVQLQKILSENQIDYMLITAASQSATIIIELESGAYVYVKNADEALGQIPILSQIITRTGIEQPGKKISYIDLRFENPIVKFK